MTLSLSPIVQPCDFLLRRLRLAMRGGESGGAYVLPDTEQGNIFSASSATTLADEFGVLVDLVPTAALNNRPGDGDGSRSGGEGTRGDQKAPSKRHLPGLQSAPPLSGDADGPPCRANVAQIWECMTTWWNMKMEAQFELSASVDDVRSSMETPKKFKGSSVSLSRGKGTSMSNTARSCDLRVGRRPYYVGHRLFFVPLGPYRSLLRKRAL